ncbi:MAG: hypothetical protein WD200_00645 [Candidatus Andersenbacteria bacterium]
MSSIIDHKLLKQVLDWAYSAHQEHNTRDDVRAYAQTPYIAHPIWAAFMLLNDTRLPFKDREIGYQALLLHDVLEDTSKGLPDFVSDEVKRAVEEMTHTNWKEEQNIASKSDFIKLLKLCDKMATMYDENMKPDPKKRREWLQLLEALATGVEKTYGNTRVVVTARAILANTDW